MTRSSRAVLRLAATTLLPFLVFSVADRAVISAQTNSPSVARPNIVLFVADDLGVTDIGPYGAKRVRTPNLDRLAAQSMRFDRAYAGSPTCVPSRATLYTGLMPFRNGAHPNHSQSREDTGTPLLLRSLHVAMRRPERMKKRGAGFQLAPRKF
jgi:hypothetical protein